jgi:hypothetical protein
MSDRAMIPLRRRLGRSRRRPSWATKRRPLNGGAVLHAYSHPSPELVTNNMDFALRHVVCDQFSPRTEGESPACC